MPKRKLSSSDLVRAAAICSMHSFGESDIAAFRKDLLQWYDVSKRDLPWRTQEEGLDINQRAYGVWVSEMMLQQTQVATVLDYYKRWMKKWPTIADLSKATTEEVNEMWAGLGYYSRGRRLHEGAVKVMKEFGGEIPTTMTGLLENLPGVGKYTAAAIASIAFNQVTGLVDGNVLRVFSRMRLIGADVSSRPVTEHMWKLANEAVDERCPGDFNQALMELGATVCSPKSPSCGQCPVRSLCLAHKQVEKNKKKPAKTIFKPLQHNSSAGHDTCQLADIEDITGMDHCHLCLPEEDEWQASLGVQNYPRKGKKKPAKEERLDVCVAVRDRADGEEEYLTVQRPDTGLLAGLWEFPNIEVSDDEQHRQKLLTQLMERLLPQQVIDDAVKTHVGEVKHMFSHRHHTYIVQCWRLTCPDPASSSQQTPHKWLTKSEFLAAAVSTAMKKVFNLLQGKLPQNKMQNKVPKPANSSSQKQTSLDAFFKKRVK